MECVAETFGMRLDYKTVEANVLELVIQSRCNEDFLSTKQEEFTRFRKEGNHVDKVSGLKVFVSRCTMHQ